MASFRYRLSLGSDQFVEDSQWRDELWIDLKKWRDGKPTKKGIRLTLMRWKNCRLEYKDRALDNKTSYEYHIDGNVYCTITENGVCVDIRPYWKPEDQVVPTTKGIYLRPSKYVRLKELLPEIGNALPELNGVIPCLLQSDHMNPLGALQCSECNPNDFYN